MGKWLQEKQMTAFEVTYQGKTKTLQDWSKGISCVTVRALGLMSASTSRDVVNITSGLALSQHFCRSGPRSTHVLGSVHRRQPQATGRQRTTRLAGGNRTKDAIAVLDALELLDGDRVEPANSAMPKRCSSA